MDQNYSLDSLELTLETTCAVQAVSNILHSGKAFLRSGSALEEIERDASETINGLRLPSCLRRKMKCLLRPLLQQIVQWPHDLKSHGLVKPIWTPQGTANIIRGVRTILANETLDLRYRFAMACSYCQDKHIRRIWSQLSAFEKHAFSLPSGYLKSCSRLPAKWGMYTIIWLNSLSVSPQYDGESLPQEAYDNGFKFAVKSCDDLRACIYGAKTSSRMVLHVLHGMDFDIGSFSPSTLCCMFSRLDEDDRLAQQDIFESGLMDALLRWPYQPHFLKAARSLWKRHGAPLLVAKISERREAGWMDYDYWKLVGQIWELLEIDWRQTSHRAQMRREDKSLVSKEEHVAGEFLSDLTPLEAGSFLRSHAGFMVCMLLVKAKEFKQLEQMLLYVTFDGLTSKVQFKSGFLSFMSDNCSRSSKESGDLTVCQQRFAEIIDRFIEVEEDVN